MTIEFFTNVNYVMKLRFVTDERTNGDIEALADAMRALKKKKCFQENLWRTNLLTVLSDL